jgi:soluble lytic murein transglycosylase
LGFALPGAEEGLAHIAAGRKAQLQDRIQDALANYADPSADESPMWECAAFWRAELLVQTGRIDQARPLYERLFRAAPEPSYRTEAAAFLADDAETRADAAGAVTYLRALSDASPDDPAPRARLAALLEGLHREGEARVLALWLWTKSPSSPAALAYFKAHPSWTLAFSSLPNPNQLERLRSLAREGSLNTLATELRKFKPLTGEEAGWAKYLQGRLLEARGGAAEAVKVYSSVAAPPEARFASLGRLGSALPRAGVPERDREAAEALVISLPQSFEGRQKALVSLMKWRIAQPHERRARTLAEALLAGKTAQLDACEYLFDTAWTKWLSSDRRGAEALWRVLADRLPTESDYYHASGYALYRLGRMTPQEAAWFREITLEEDRYGYFGYRMRGSPPPRVADPAPPPDRPVAVPGSHVEKAQLLVSAGLLSDSVREFQLALTQEENSAARERILWAQSLARAAAEDYAGAIRTARVLYPRVFNENGDALPPDTWRLLYPVPFQNDVMKSAREAALPYLLACSVIRQESLWDPQAVSRSGARGLMQLMPATASALARKYKFPFTPPECYADPAWNTRAGCVYLRQLMDRYRGRLDLALAAYNAGPGRVNEWLARPGCPKDPDLFVESIPFKETRSYVRRILLNCWEYSRLYEGFPAPLAPGAGELAALAGG